MKTILGRSRYLLALLSLTLFAPSTALTQEVGRIVGRVVDTETGAGLSSVTVQVAGTRIGALTSVDGRFVIPGVPAGNATLRVTTIGYAIKTVTGIEVRAKATIEQNIALDPSAVEIAAVEVTAAAERGSVNRALDQQRTATGIVNAITAEQISRSPDGDAAAAVQRVAGVTLQDNKYVQVRGLGERYTTTSLNGARIPSPEPEKKLVPLDLFPAGLLETITTAKTFTPDLPGDFSGAQVDIKTREFPAEREQAFSTALGFNHAARGTVFTAPRSGSEWLGLAAGDRTLPSSIRSAGNFHQAPSQGEVNGFVNSFRNAWSARSSTATPNTSLGATVGGNGDIFGRNVGYVASGTYSYGQEVRLNEVRALALAGENGVTSEIDRYEGSTGRTTVLWGGVVNASTLLGSSSRIALNTTYNRSADNEARFELGSSENLGGLPLQVTRLRYVERSVKSAQLMGEHEGGDRHRIDWKVTGSAVSRVEPDRSEVVYASESDPVTGMQLRPAWFSTSGEGAVRTFGDLNEKALEIGSSYKLTLGANRQHALKFGGMYRLTDRDSDNRVYSITAPTLPRTARELRPEEIFDGRFSAPESNIFRVAPLSQGGSYTAEDRLAAGYAMIEFAASSKLRVITGARIENSQVEINAEPTVGAAVLARPEFTDVLPALTLNFQLAETQNLRFSASQTLSRPEYRELAEIQYRDVIGGDNIIGNPNLKRTLIRNLDVRWELYPSSGEILSLGVFGKQFQDPIERVYLGTSGTRVVTFLNADGAHNYGVEVEARKRFGFLHERLEQLTAFVNATVMESQIEIGDAESGASKIGDKRAMVGQSPYVVNLGTTYASESGQLSATVLYNVTGRRIVNASERPLPDVFEQSRHVVDLALRFPFLDRVSGKVDIKNVFDSPYEITQGVAMREFYRSGRIVSAGLSWRPHF